MSDEPIHVSFLDGGLRARRPLTDAERRAIAQRREEAMDAHPSAQASLVDRLATEAEARVRETKD